MPVMVMIVMIVIVMIVIVMIVIVMRVFVKGVLRVMRVTIGMGDGDRLRIRHLVGRVHVRFSGFAGTSGHLPA
jgi:hypothetical protein